MQMKKIHMKKTQKDLQMKKMQMKKTPKDHGPNATPKISRKTTQRRKKQRRGKRRTTQKTEQFPRRSTRGYLRWAVDYIV